MENIWNHGGDMARNYASEYNNYHSQTTQKKRRAMRNKGRRLMIRKGRAKKGDGKDVHHADRNPSNNSAANLRIKSKAYNRSRNS